ncbi:MAG: hypothetical protein G01um101429_538 [Parcubacteria group bacterium Gr01-1014_29]|nr:MAG: hypothetical protein G01um101429_538 [Parcubacteria group bacterium Gr01-1014_29]
MNEKQKFLRILLLGLGSNLLLAGIAISFHVFFIRPSYRGLKNAEQTLATLEKKESSLRSLAREVNTRSNDINRLDAAFLHTDNIVVFVTLLETIAKSSGTTITINTATINNSDQGLEAQKSSFTISLIGSLQSIVQFVTLVENVPYFTEISSLTISTQSGQPSATLALEVLTL